MVEVATGRVIQEVQAAMTVAKRFPRDELAASERIRKACCRVGLAEQAIYQYPRGGTKVQGPSIRLAEAIAQNWGNLDFGIVEIEQRQGASEVMAYCVDLETNTRQTKIFTVKHERHSKKGVQSLTDPRDIYEAVANNGARRMRACILGVIPGDVQDLALAQCAKTLAGQSKEPIADRIRKVLAGFAEFDVTPAMLCGRLGYRLESIDEHAIAGLRKIYTSLRDGMSTREDWFDVASADAAQSHVDQAAGIAKEAAATTRAVADEPAADGPTPETEDQLCAEYAQAYQAARTASKVAILDAQVAKDHENGRLTSKDAKRISEFSDAAKQAQKK